jgi:hypothetical protein
MKSNAAFPIDADTTAAVACPKCDVIFAFHRNATPRVDASGFESYSFECVGCGVALAGVVDPYDDTLLLCEIPEAADVDAERPAFRPGSVN